MWKIAVEFMAIRVYTLRTIKEAQAMKRWAVGYISFHDNEVRVEIVYGDDWHDALLKHSQLQDWTEPLTPSSIEITKQQFFDCDSMFDVVEIA